MGLSDPIDPDHETACPPGLHAGQGVLENRRLVGVRSQRAGSSKISIERWLSRQVRFDGHIADTFLEEVVDGGGRQRLSAVGTRRRHPPPWTGSAKRPERSERSGIGLDTVFSELAQYRLVPRAGEPANGLGPGLITGIAPRWSM